MDDKAVAWLRAQAEARLATAIQACHGTEGHWWRGKDEYGPRGHLYDGDPVVSEDDWVLGAQEIVVYDEGSPSGPQFEHIALNDPRDTIARCEAELAILDAHEESESQELRHGHWEGHGSNEHWVRDEPNDCPVCVTWISGVACPEQAPCSAVRHLASAYKHREGYAEHWGG